MSDVYARPDTASLIATALAEDLGETGDLTVQAMVPADGRLRGVMTAKEDGVICGVPLFAQVCEQVAAGTVSIVTAAADGDRVTAGAEVLRCEGSAATILIAERTALNLMQRLSGVATTAARYAEAIAGTMAKVLDTRKTTPGLRFLEKHAVAAGGGANHRIGLFDQVLIKENHIALMGAADPAAAVTQARAEVGPDRIVQVEIERLADLEPVIQAGADIVMLDNLPPAVLREAVAIRGDRPVALEASGGITIDTIRAFAETGIERISIGALTHSVKALDLSLRCTTAL